MRPHCAGLMDTNGAVIRSNGKYPWTASRSGSVVTVTFTVPYNFPYGVIANAESTSAYCVITYGPKTPTSFTLKCAEGFPTTLSFLTLTYDSGLG